MEPGSKQAMLITHLTSPGGSSIDQLSMALGWQRHTIQAAITGLRQKGFRVTRSKSGDGRTVYQALCPTWLAPAGDRQTEPEE